MEFWILILVSFFVTNSLDKSESLHLEETPLKIIDEIFGEGWWDNEKDEEWNKLTLEHNFHHQIDRQNTQIGEIESNSIDQFGQIEPNSTDQNPTLTESDHSDNAKNGEEENEISSNKKRQIVDKFHAIKDEFKQKGKYSAKERTQIEDKIDETVAKELGLSDTTIYNWKSELGQTKPNKHSDSEQKELLMKHY
uniref:Uncharacterized protein n=1 Tax=Globodera rostochiensis TaxID=31243 RepID=A0A914HU57_GLORO